MCMCVCISFIVIVIATTKNNKKQIQTNRVQCQVFRISFEICFKSVHSAFTTGRNSAAKTARVKKPANASVTVHV